MKAPSLAITSATPRHGGFVAKGRIGLVLSKALAIGAVAAVFATCGVARAETIESALAKAYQNNPQLNAQRAIVRQTDENVSQALAGTRPTISATVSAGKEYTDMTEVFPPIPGTALSSSTSVRVKGRTNPRSSGVNASQTLFDGFQTPNRTRAAEAQVFAARETLRVIEQSVLLSAAAVYMDVLRDSANLEVQRSNVRVLQEGLRVTNARYSDGAITFTDVAQSEAQLAGAEATLHAAESTLLTTRANYRRIIGLEPENLTPSTPVDRYSPRTVKAAIEQGLSQNPSVTGAMYDVDVALLQVKIAEGGLYPTLALQGDVQKQHDANILTPKLFTSSVMVGLTVPIYQGGREYSAIRQNKEAVGQRRLNVDQVRDQVRSDVIRYWGQIDAVKAQMEAAKRQVKASEVALDGVRDEAGAGQRTTLDVLNAQQALVNARINLITAQHDRVVVSYSLVSAVGRLSAAVLRLPVEVYDPTVHYQQVRDSWFGVRTPDGR
jgi:outer membrane protein